MGIFRYPLTLIGPAGEASVEAMVDTGASYSAMPSDLLERLGIRPMATS